MSILNRIGRLFAGRPSATGVVTTRPAPPPTASAPPRVVETYAPYDENRTSLQQQLLRLANTAWSRSGPPTSAWQLEPDRLPKGTTPSAARAVLSAFYEHARGCAGGFEIPYSIPEVRFTNLTDAAGEFRVNQDGFASVILPPSTCANENVLRAVLAHEACHHILGLSGLSTRNAAVDEPLTDVAMFVCGLGKVFMRGSLVNLSREGGWMRLHLGYLSEDEYAYLSRWADNPTQVIGSTAVAARSDHKRRKLLTKLGGSESTMRRYIDFERQKAPGASEEQLIENALERLESARS